MRLEIEVGSRVRVVALEHRGKTLVVSLDGVERVVDAVALGGHRWSLRFPDSGAQHAVVVTPGHESGSVEVLVDGLSIPARLRPAGREAAKASGGPRGAGKVIAPMPGKVVKVLVTEGQEVAAGAALVVLEAMKMEHTVRAAEAGTVQALHVAVGDQVDADRLLAVVT